MSQVDESSPTWWKILNMDASLFSKSRGDKHRWQLKDYTVLNKVAKDMYTAVGDEIKEFNSYHRVNGNSFDKVRLGKRICSIPMTDYVLHPELAYDDKALRKYLAEHPECKADRWSKHGPIK